MLLSDRDAQGNPIPATGPQDLRLLITRLHVARSLPLVRDLSEFLSPTARERADSAPRESTDVALYGCCCPLSLALKDATGEVWRVSSYAFWRLADQESGKAGPANADGVPRNGVAWLPETAQRFIREYDLLAGRRESAKVIPGLVERRLLPLALTLTLPGRLTP